MRLVCIAGYCLNVSFNPTRSISHLHHLVVSLPLFVLVYTPVIVYKRMRYHNLMLPSTDNRADKCKKFGVITSMYYLLFYERATKIAPLDFLILP